MQVAAAMLLWRAVLLFVAVLVWHEPPGTATLWANLALIAFTGMSFLLALGGLWFAHWVKQEGLQPSWSHTGPV